jgi:hypothetical protein
VTIDRREQTIRFDSLPGPPAMVAFDDENAVVKRLAFDQPTPWLAALLERHPQLWQRAWAVEQLGDRSGDSLAGAALARAARGADYALTRAEAAAALGRFPVAVALPALEAAARDTSAQVRWRPCRRSGPWGVARALSRERSLAVRLELRGSCRRAPGARPARRAGRPRSGAQRPGHAVVSRRHPERRHRRRGPAARPRAGGRPGPAGGRQQLPAVALAALAARGDSSARRAVVVMLDDERAWVRGWALEALEDQLDGPAAVALLREAQPNLTHQPARAAVIEAISRLERSPS